MAPRADREPDPLGSVSIPELIRMLEHNGYLQAADDLRAGKSVVEATAYVAGGSPHYEDDEGWRLQRFIDDLHQRAP